MQRNLMKLLLLLVIFFYFSCLFSASAFPVTSKIFFGFLTQYSSLFFEHVLGNGDEVVVDMKEEVTERRVYLETEDYEGTGANRDHDPKSPGGV
ncbi:uncharacterized protein LOC106753724 [Vigna radiata var. radiata]|uniref:Uncharacterized protein LOC106753724 n=1 Tax=Vigna radiata var. radiata TaxID=3916 RepID=A0A1S3TBD3_VIGRR|nr:uncharacterized protein LOC106753724 [Vigna radiata var. radiata]